jgi:hypothetical protein
MKTAIAILVLSIGCNVTLLARIGETEQQVEARYGKSIGMLSRGDELPHKAYRFSGLDIVVGFIDGVSQSEFFYKHDKSDFSPNEIALLLEANAGGGKWVREPKTPSGIQGWKVLSGGRSAEYAGGNKALAIWTDLSLEISQESKAKAEAKKLKGF